MDFVLLALLPIPLIGFMLWQLYKGVTEQEPTQHNLESGSGKQ